MCVHCSGATSVEKFVAEKNAELDRMRDSVAETIEVTDNVNLHLVDAIPQSDKTSLINWILQMEKVAPAPGTVDIFAPFTSYADSAGVTARVNDEGYYSLDIESINTDVRRIMMLSPRLFFDNRIRTASNRSQDEVKWTMPVAQNVNEPIYTFVHEWGHVQDTRHRDDDTMARIDLLMILSVGLGDPDSDFVQSLSTYGLSGEPEAYAESFAEWHISKGQTDNFAAKWYAKEYDWFKYDNNNK